MSNQYQRRLKRHGQTAIVYELRCPACKRGVLLAAGEMAPMTAGLVPYCNDCKAVGVVSQMTVKRYSSGPPDLHV